MIIPKYVHVEEKQDEVILTSDIDGTQVILRGPNTIADFAKIRQGQEVDNGELNGKLKMTGMYVDLESFTEIATKYRDKLANTLRLTIMPTLNCNFRCVYCYEDHSSPMMTEDTFEGILAHINNDLENVNVVNVGWFGGEPLLAADLIIKYSEKIKDVVEAAGKRYSSNMTTNGYLLDIETFKKLYEAGVTNYQITLDGFEHDKKRVLVDGGPTLQVILDNLAAIHQLDSTDYKFEVLLRRNILLNESLEWYDFIHDIVGDDDRFRFIIRRVFPTDRMDTTDIAAQLQQEWDKHEEYCKKYFKTYDSVERKGPTQGICYAAMPKGFVVLPDGSIQKCTTTSFKEDWQKVGVVTKSGFEIDDDKNKEWTYAPLTEKCLHCEELLTCMNMKCPRQRQDPHRHRDMCC